MTSRCSEGRRFRCSCRMRSCQSRPLASRWVLVWMPSSADANEQTVEGCGGGAIVIHPPPPPERKAVAVYPPPPSLAVQQGKTLN